MYVQSIVAATGSALLSTALVLAPLAVATIVVRAIDERVESESRRLAWPMWLAVVAGLLLGIATIEDSPILEVMNAREILAPDGPWSLTREALLFERFPAVLAGLGPAIGMPLDQLSRPLAMLIVVAIVCASASLILPFVMVPVRRAMVLALVDLCLMVLALVALVYVACIGPWLVNLLNFWAIGLLGLIYHFWRHGPS
ncbi:MAG: hypothetical protein U1E45_20685 [Geminicoccaceae bacterium]